ncbi:MAG: hypothetical protein WBI96_03475 [Candidatus Hydrothermia bacterium]
MVRLPREIIFLFFGVAITLFALAIFRKSPQPKTIIQTITDTVIVEKTRIQVKPLKPETLRVCDTLTHHDTIRVIEWREYSYRDSILSLSIVADTVKSFSYDITPRTYRMPSHQVIVMATPSSVLGLATITKNVVVGAGWNLSEKVPEIAVGVSVKW